ncbi:MAG: ribonucleoside hydrolase RihC [Verrucomicrobiales bacterium]|nr:ribonucleoside hydrolase RihC [Verrucomicrobiales bacterium]
MNCARSLFFVLCLFVSFSGFSQTNAPAKGYPFKVISRGRLAGEYQAFPDICRSKTGELLCVFYAGYAHVSLPAPDFPKGGRICLARSDDDGNSWGDPTILYDDANDNRDPHISQLSDGTLICSFFSFTLKGDRVHWTPELNKPMDELASLVGVQMVRSRSNGERWEPEATIIASGWACSAPVRQINHGLCMLGIYQEDSQKGTAWGGVIQSKDHGKTWGLPISIGKTNNLYLDAETDVISLKDGRILAALRSSKGNLFFSRSRDKGKTWSTPKDAGFPAQSPHFTRMKNGTIILSHRIPQTAVHLSYDEGNTWQGPFHIDDTAVGAYPSTVELRDGSVLIAYYTEGPQSEIRVKKFHVSKDGISLAHWEK